jgi:hypothetical protein
MYKWLGTGPPEYSEACSGGDGPEDDGQIEPCALGAGPGRACAVRCTGLRAQRAEAANAFIDELMRCKLPECIEGACW